MKISQLILNIFSHYNITDAVLPSAAAPKLLHINSQIDSRGCDAHNEAGVSCYLNRDN